MGLLRQSEERELRDGPLPLDIAIKGAGQLEQIALFE
jgi:hypothetical protein